MDAFSTSGASYASKVDQHVGERIRRRRIMLGYTQEQLADALEISYQQIQKYETGANRISAGRLFQIAERLETNVGHFFGGLEGGALGIAEKQTDDDGLQGSTRLIIELVRHFNAIPDQQIKASVSSLVKSLVPPGSEPIELDESGNGVDDNPPSHLQNGTNGHANGRDTSN